MIIADSLSMKRSVRAMSVLLLVLVGCAAGSGEPRTGAISFRVTWSGSSDIDLYVVSPLGEQINYVLPRAASGGELDVDCNFHGVHMCDTPMENIYWPKGRAPDGVYRAWILLPDAAGMGEEDLWTFEVRRSRTVIWSVSGLVSDLRQTIPRIRVNHPGGPVELDQD